MTAPTAADVAHRVLAGPGDRVADTSSPSGTRPS
ncbi:hypothetical protein SAMN04488107_2658 [Geodermatophilus saharensis]|uniref:Uncharacterized protein n=1 Tax=Geodermatophilus saharensis TaxID=1137994 RepID=A0A239EPV4_9ACTN|nr:hypothetical protein SAMN04488107_2658 [Geodermatophilus saharensis]